jgi:hypothetical protein
MKGFLLAILIIYHLDKTSAIENDPKRPDNNDVYDKILAGIN